MKYNRIGLCLFLVSVFPTILFFVANCIAANNSVKGFYDPDQWFSNPVAGFSSAKISTGDIFLCQKGALTHKDKWKISQLSFNIQFDDLIETKDNYIFIIQFSKTRRSSFYGEPHNRGATNHSYGLLFSKKGRVLLARFSKNNDMQIIGRSPLIIDPLKKNHVQLGLDRTENDVVFNLKVNNGASVTLRDKSKQSESLNPQGYITLLNLPVGITTHLSNISIEAFGFSADEKDKPNSVYLLEYFENQTSNFIHWRYNERTQDYAGVNIYDQNKLLTHLKHPVDRFLIPNNLLLKKLIVKAVDIDGDESEGVEIKLESNEALLIEKDIQRIIVSPQKPYAQLIKKRTSHIFNIRGINYVRLSFGDHSTFIAKNSYLPDLYDPYDTEGMLRVLKRHNYNTVRVFLTGRSPSNPGIAGYPQFNESLYKPYLDNLIDFLRRAKKYGIYVLPTFGDGEFPFNAYYKSIYETLGRQTGETVVMGQPYNFVYLLPEGIRSRTTMIVETLRYIKKVDPTLLDIILAVQCQNELSLRSNQWPFSLTSGNVTTANGKRYDMSDADSRQRCMDEGLNYYHKMLSKAIKEVDSELLVSEGAFTLRAVGKTSTKNNGVYKLEVEDSRFPPTAIVLGNSGLDIIDIHIYHVFTDETSVAGYRRDMDSMLFYTDQMNKVRSQTPIIVGEFGAFRFVNKTFEDAKPNIISSRKVFSEDHLNGFMIWTFDTFEQQELYHALDGGLEFLSELNGP